MHRTGLPSTRRIVLIGVATTLLQAAPALAVTHYASTSGIGTNWPCTSASTPCDLVTAIEGSGPQTPAPGDEVAIESGSYSLSGTEIAVPVPEDIEGVGGIPQISVSGIGNFPFLTLPYSSHPSQLRHVEISESGNSATQEVRVQGNAVLDDDFFTSGSTGATALYIQGDGVRVLDTVVLAAGPGSVAVDWFNPGASLAVRNLTVYATGSGGGALQMENVGCPSSPVMSVRNSIVEAPSGAPLKMLQNTSCAGPEHLTFDVDYSDFDPSGDSLGAIGSLSAGAHDITGTPKYASGLFNFNEAPNSPTVDAGTNDALDGQTDPAGRQRLLGSAPDIGAYELPAPYPVTLPTGPIGPTSATVTGTVDPEGSDLTTSYHFLYGPDGQPPASTPVQMIPAAQTPIPDPRSVSAQLTGLAPSQAYIVELVASNSDGVTYSHAKTFTTPPATYQLTIHVAGTGAGRVMLSGPPSPSCKHSCERELPSEQAFVLHAQPAINSMFAGWHGAGCSGTGPCAVTMTSDQAVTATFSRAILPRLGGLSFKSSPPGIPRLSFTLRTRAGQPALTSLSIHLPAGLKLAALAGGVKVSVETAKPRLRGGALMLSFITPARRVTVTISPPALSESRALARAIKRARLRQVMLLLFATDTVGDTLRLATPVRISNPPKSRKG